MDLKENIEGMSMQKKAIIGLLGLIIVVGIVVLIFLPTPPSAPVPLIGNEATTTPNMEVTTKSITTSKSSAPKAQVQTQTTPPEQVDVMTAGVAIKNACSFLTPRLILELTGIAVDEGASKPSSVGGSLCEFKSASGSEVALQVGEKQYAAAKGSWSGVVDLTGVGESAYYQIPESKSANGVVIKGKLFAQVSLYNTKSTLTAAGVKNILSYLADQL